MYFLKFAETKQLFEIFNKNNIEARFVGGCVRDALCGIATNDFDIAVDCEVNKLRTILEKAQVNIIKIDIKYFSVTVIINNRKFEITSLRKDTKCDGRQCCVSRISDFEQDAMRRDFTINALYVDQFGQLFDYFDGQKDLENNTIRFIGEPYERIKEDYLRIFRYYRFCAKYGDLSNKYTDVIKSLSHNVSKLPIERVQSELINILHYKNNVQIIKSMIKDNVIKANIDLYERMVNIYPNSKTALKLYILFSKDSLFNIFKLPKRYKLIIKEYLKYENEPLIYVAYKTSLEIQQDIIVIKHLKHNEPITHVIKKEFLAFPITYKDICDTIPHPGKLLKDCERWWILNDFIPSKDECLTYIKTQFSKKVTHF